MQQDETADIDELDVAQTRAEEAWSALLELNERMTSSPRAYRELSARRERLEAELTEALADIGAVVFEQLRGSDAAANDRRPHAPAAPSDAPAEATELAAGEDDSAADPAPPPAAPPESSAGGRARILGRVEHELAPSGAAPEPEPVISSAHVASVLGKMGPRFEDETSDETFLQAAEHLPGIKSRLGSPPDSIETFPQFMGELGTLTSATRDAELAVWAKLPAEVQRCLSGYIVARLRHLQDEVPSAVAGTASSDGRMSDVFTRLNRHLSDERPGFVYGMKREHSPKGGSWRADAETYRRQLAELAKKYYGDGEDSADAADEFNVERALYEIESMLAGDWKRTELVASVEEALDAGLEATDSRLVRLLRPYRDFFVDASNDELYAALSRDPASSEESDAADEADHAELVPEGWPWRDYLRRARTVMVGGDPRPEARDRIIDAFGLSVFQWVPTTDNKGVRQVQSLCGRIERGTVDVVFLLTKYISHKLSNQVSDAVKGADVHLVYLNDGYGVSHIKRAIEEAIPRQNMAQAVAE